MEALHCSLKRYFCTFFAVAKSRSVMTPIFCCLTIYKNINSQCFNQCPRLYWLLVRRACVMCLCSCWATQNTLSVGEGDQIRLKGEDRDSISSVVVRRCGARKWLTSYTEGSAASEYKCFRWVTYESNASETGLVVPDDQRYCALMSMHCHSDLWFFLHNSRSLAATRALHRSPCVRETHRSHEAVKKSDFSNEW